MKYWSLLSLALLLSFTGGPSWSAAPEHKIVETLDAFLRSSYARDATEAYQYLSKADREVKSEEQYVSENGNYSGFALELSKRLSSEITLTGVRVSISGDRASVTFNATLPDANHPSLAEIVEGFNSERLKSLDADTRSARLERLGKLANSNQLAVLNGEHEQWELIREEGEWRVFVNWADAIEVTFSAIVSKSLGWEFYPTQNLVLAQPGQTIQMAYIAVNTGDEVTTGKARHTVGASNIAEHLEIVACFCFLEQSLTAGESVELPLVFRVDYDVPEEVKSFTVNYEFFAESEFPEGEMS